MNNLVAAGLYSNGTGLRRQGTDGSRGCGADRPDHRHLRRHRPCGVDLLAVATVQGHHHRRRGDQRVERPDLHEPPVGETGPRQPTGPT